MQTECVMNEGELDERFNPEPMGTTRDAIAHLAVWAHMTQPLPVHISRCILLLVLNADLVLSSVLWSLLVIFSMALCLLLGGSRSVLFKTTTMRGQVSSPISRHSAVWVCTPFTTSTTSIMRSMIWAPIEGLNANNNQEDVRCYWHGRKAESWSKTTTTVICDEIHSTFPVVHLHNDVKTVSRDCEETMKLTAAMQTGVDTDTHK